MIATRGGTHAGGVRVTTVTEKGGAPGALGVGLARARALAGEAWRSWAAAGVAAWAATRAMLLLAGYVATHFLQATISQNVPQVIVGRTADTMNFMDLVWRTRQWDAAYYATIAAYGYENVPEAGFTPLFPALIHGVLVAFSGPLDALAALSGVPVLDRPDWTATIATLVVGNLATLAAYCALAALARDLGAPVRGTLRALACYPFAFFLAVGYGDGLFLALGCGALLAARHRRALLAAALLAAAALSRLTALVVIAPALACYLQAGGWRPGAAAGAAGESWASLWRAVGRVGAMLLAAPLALLGFALYCGAVLGDPSAPWRAERDTFRHVTMAPWTALSGAWAQLAGLPRGSFAEVRGALDDAAVLLLIGGTLVAAWPLLRPWLRARVLPYLAPAAARFGALAPGKESGAGEDAGAAKKRRGEAAWMTLWVGGLALLTVCTPILGTQFPLYYVSAGRYALAAAPLWIVLGRRLARSSRAEGERGGLDLVWTAGGAALQAVLLAFYLSGGWLV